MLLFITQHSGKTTAHPTRVTYKCGSNIPVKSPPGLKKNKSQKDISTQFKKQSPPPLLNRFLTTGDGLRHGIYGHQPGPTTDRGSLGEICEAADGYFKSYGKPGTRSTRACCDLNRHCLQPSIMWTRLALNKPSLIHVVPTLQTQYAELGFLWHLKWASREKRWEPMV